MQTELLTLDQVINRVQMSKSTIYKLIGKDKFPKPVKPTPKMSRWRMSQIEDWENKLGT